MAGRQGGCAGGCLTIVGILVVVGIVGSMSEKGPKSFEPATSQGDVEHAKDESRTSEKPPCGRDDLQCWGDRLSISAGFKCTGEVERLAKYELKWTDSWYEPKFFRFHWANSDHSAVTLLGDRAKMSNAFGAFQNIVYECDMQTSDDSVQDVRAREGHLR